MWWCGDRKSTRLNSSHTEIYTLSLHDALPISGSEMRQAVGVAVFFGMIGVTLFGLLFTPIFYVVVRRSEEHTSELQSHRDLHSFPTRRSSDLRLGDAAGGRRRRLLRHDRRHPVRPVVHADLLCGGA